MKTAFALAAAGLLAAGCATQDVQVAQAPAPTCKIAPITTTSVTQSNNGKSKPVDSLRQREAQMDLASSQYRFQQLSRNGVFNNNLEEAMRDCDAAR